MTETTTEQTVGVEHRTVEHIPENERHGRARDLFTIWFGSNIMLLTVATGAVGTAVYGLSVWSTLIALVIGNVVGGVVMALHAAQGPQMGVPQMLQTRAQFGSYGSLLVVVIVIFMYLGFFASNMVLGGEALEAISPIPQSPAIILIGSISVIGAVVGYRLIHALTGVLSVISGLVMVLAFVWALGVDGLPHGTLTNGSFTWAGFMSTLSLAALWQIAYAPYVSDYTRYMPKDTGIRPSFWATYSGAVLGSVLPMILGAFAGAAFPKDDTVPALQHLAHGIGGLVVAVFGLAIAVTNAMNLYCGALSTLTIGQTLRPSLRAKAGARAGVCVVLFGIALVLGLAGKDNFLVNFTNFMSLLLCVLIPWTAVNLVDYYLLRHGSYDIDSLFRSDGGVYGRLNPVAVFCYLLGIAIQLPFINTTLWTGTIAGAFKGVDISWIVGLVVISPVYYLLMRRFRFRRSLPAPPAAATTTGELV